jgi:hypothetical protein
VEAFFYERERGKRFGKPDGRRNLRSSLFWKTSLGMHVCTCGDRSDLHERERHGMAWHGMAWRVMIIAIVPLRTHVDDPRAWRAVVGGLMDKGAPTTVCRVPDDRVDRCHVWWGMMYS